MTTAEYALIVSIASVFVSFGALFWNVWQKFLFVKPTLQVSFGVWRIWQPSAPDNHNRRLLNLTITNMGPGPAVLAACVGKPKKPWWKRAKNSKLGLLNPIHGDPVDPNPVASDHLVADCPLKLMLEKPSRFIFLTLRIVFFKRTWFVSVLMTHTTVSRGAVEGTCARSTSPIIKTLADSCWGNPATLAH
jgi:hypothetical protein